MGLKASARRRAYDKAWRERKRRAGECSRCSEKSLEGLRYCKYHRAAESIREIRNTRKYKKRDWYHKSHSYYHPLWSLVNRSIWSNSKNPEVSILKRDIAWLERDINKLEEERR